MPIVLLPSRGGGMCCEKSAEAIVVRTTTDEGPNFVLRTEPVAVRETGDIESRTEMCGANAEGTGRNPGVAVLVCQCSHWREDNLSTSLYSW